MEKSTACSSTALVDSPMSKKPVLTRQHTLEAAQSVVMEAQPTAFASQPTTTISQPATTLSQPTTSISQPSTTISQPTSSLSQLSTSVPQPISSISQPSTTISQATTFITQAQPVISKLDTPLVISVPVTAAVCHSNNISPAPSRDEDSQPPIEELLIKQSSTDSGIGEGKKKGAAKQGKYPCRFCDHTCNKPSVLEKHLRTHTGERPYPCDVCNQSFKTNSNLYKHRKTQGHMLKCKERGISLDESRDESCGSSRDETSFDVDYNMDIEEDRHSVSENNTQISPRPAKEPSSKQIDALKQLESLCNLLDSDTKWSDYTLTNRFESMSDKTTKITLSLIKTKVIPTPKLGTLRLFPLPPVRSNSVPVTERGENSSKVEARIDNIIQSNEKIVGPRVPPPRRLSRQNSVTSPTAHMFASASSVEEVFSPVIPEADFPLETNNIEQSINDLLEKSREELTFVENALSLIQVDQKESALDIHLKLPSADSNTQTASMKRSGYSAHKYSLVCSLCGAVFGRADIFDIHKRFYCIKKSPGRVLSKAKSEDHVTHHPPSLTDRPKLLHSTSEMPLSNITEYRPPSAPRTSTPKECLKNHLLTKQKSSSYSTDVPTIITNSSPLQCTGSVVNLAPKPMRHSPINIPTVTKPIIMSPVILSSPGVIPAFRPLFTAVQQIPPNPAFIPTSAMVVSPPLARTPSTELPRQSSFNKTISPLVASPLLTSAGYSPRFIRSPLIMNSQSFSPGAHQTVVQTTPINTKQSTLIPRPKSIDPTRSPPVTSGGGTTTKLIERRPFIPTSRSTSVKEKPTPKQNKMSGHSFDSQTSSTTIKLQIPLKRVAPTSDLPIPPSKIINIPTSAPNKIQQHEPTNLLINTKAGANSRKPSTNQLFAAASTNQMISPLYPITYHALLPHFDGDYIVEWRKKLKNEGVASMFEFQSTDCCSCHRIIPATQPHPPKYSSYSQWVTAPRSNYNPVDALNSYCSSSHHSTQYSICKGDTRCSPTHSAYWKLARGLKDTSGTSLPISRIHSQPTAKIEQTTNDIKPLVKGPSYKAPSSAAKFTWPTTVVQTVLQPKAKPVESTVKSCHASVIVAPRDSGSKQLNRSQSTPSSAAQQTTAEIKQKFVTGGFKSEDEYVYVRGRGRGKYVCQQCGIRCKKPSMLKKHIRTHTDLRPYSCGHCTFSFKTKGNLTKHMKSKAHHRRCLELGIYPVPTAVDDTQIDENVLATQQKISRESKIMGKCDNSEDGSSDDDDDDSDTDDTSDGEDNSNTSDDDTGNLQIDEGETTPEKDEKEDKQELTEPLMNPAVLRRVQSMPANRKQNSLDQSNETIAEKTEKDHKFITPPPKKRRKLSKLASGDSKDSTSNSFGQRSSMEEELARSLLALSTPVHRNSVEQPIAPKPEQPEKMLQSQHVSVVRGPQNNNSTVRNIASKPKLMMDNLNEPIDLSNKGETIPNLENMFICHLCRAIHETQDSLNQHMGKHKLNSKASSKLKRSFSTHLEKQSSADSNKSVPSSPSLGQLKRQFAFSQTIKDDGEIEQGEVTSSEESSDSPRKNQEKNKLKTICPFCQKVFQRTNYLTDHVTRYHPEQSDTFMVQFTSQDEPSNLSQTSPDKNTQPIPCQVCDRVFKNTSGLKQHLVSHAELRPYICEYCDAGFTTAMHLKNHLKTHTQERPYICGECGSTFARPDHLKQHSKTHR